MGTIAGVKSDILCYNADIRMTASLSGNIFQGKDLMSIDKTITGSLDVLSALELNKGMEGLDAATKNLLHQKEFLSVILMLAVKEFGGYSAREIMDFIEPSSISIEDTDVSSGRTNAYIEGDAAEFNALHEKVSYFDILLLLQAEKKKPQEPHK